MGIGLYMNINNKKNFIYKDSCINLNNFFKKLELKNIDIFVN